MTPREEARARVERLRAELDENELVGIALTGGQAGETILIRLVPETRKQES